MKKAKSNPDSSPLRILILEDNPADAELVERELRRAGINFTSRLVEGKREFSKALRDFQPQVILSDFKLPKFDGLAALEANRQLAPEIPLIFVSGSIGEEKAIEMLAQGASDYIFKDNLQRLGPAVKRVVEAACLKLEKKKNEEELQHYVNGLRLLAEAADRFVHINDLDELYDYLTQMISNISGADYLLLSLYDEKLQAIRPKIATGFEPFQETVRRRFNIDPMQMIFYFKDMRPDDFSDFISRRLVPVRDGLYGLSNRKIPYSICRLIEKLLSVGSMHNMGFSWENQLFGGVTTMFKKGNELKNPAQIEALVNQAAVAIKRLLAEKSLRESEERFRHISTTISDISYSCLSDPEGHYSLSWMTGAVERITGYIIEEIMAAKCWGNLVLDEDRVDFERYVIGLTPGNNGICELRLRHKNGNIVWVQSFAECMTNPEQPEQPIIFGALVDISERKQVETALRESEKKYRTLVTRSPDGIFVIDLQGNFLSVNQAMCDGLKFSEEEFLSLKIWDIIPEQYIDLHKKRLADILQGKEKNEAAEYMVRGKDGETHYVEILSAPFYKDNEFIGLQGIAREITEKKKMEIRLRESEEYYRTLVETSPDAIVIVDGGGRVTFASSKAHEIFGIPAQIPIIGTSMMDFVEPGEIPRVQERLVELLSGVSLPQVKEYKLQRQDRRVFWGEVSSAPLRDAAGRNIGLLLVCRDVSERKQTETERQALLEVMQGLVAAESLHDFLRNVHMSIARAIYAENFFVILYNKNTAMFEEAYSVDKFDLPAQPSKLEKSISRYVFRTGQPLMLTQEHFNKLVARGEVELVGTNSPSWLGVPLKSPRETIGVMAVQDYEKDNRYSERDLNFLASIAGQVAMVVERKWDEAALRESEEKYRLIADNTAETITMLDLNLKFTYVSPSIIKLRGYTVEEARSLNLQQTLTPDSFAKIQEVFSEEMALEASGKANPKRSRTLELQEYHKDGSIVWVENSLSYLRDAQGKAIGFLAVSKDISERKLAEAELLREKAFLEKLVESAPEGIAITDCPGLVLQVNSEFVRMFGYEVDEIVGKKIDDLVAPPEYQAEAGTLTKSSGEGKNVALETVRKRKDGTLINVSIIGAPIYTAGQQVAVYAIYRDISERKRAEEQVSASLKEKEVLLQEIHHRVKNNLQIISGLLTLQAEQSTGKPLDEIFRASQDRIRSIALIHEKLYRSQNLAEIAFDEYLRALIENLFLSHGVAAGTITIKYEMSSILFTIEKAIPLGLIVNELVTNSLKHAFPAGQRGEIRIDLHGHEGAKSYALKTDSGTLHCVPTCELIVADNGIGLPPGFELDAKKSLGMNLVSMLAKQIQAELKIKTGPGAEFRLLFTGGPAIEVFNNKEHGG
jgi:PAS domain S-box-containing protein